MYHPERQLRILQRATVVSEKNHAREHGTCVYLIHQPEHTQPVVPEPLAKLVCLAFLWRGGVVPVVQHTIGIIHPLRIGKLVRKVTLREGFRNRWGRRSSGGEERPEGRVELRDVAEKLGDALSEDRIHAYISEL